MRHPFDLEIEDLNIYNRQIDSLTGNLEFEELVPPHETAYIGGSQIATTLALGEEGGSSEWPRSYPYPESKQSSVEHPIDPPIYTTLALGEEGGANPPEVTTLALGEEGGIAIM